MLEEEDYARLARPFGEESIERKTIRGTALEYIGHAVVTARILEIDPSFTLEPAFYGANGHPLEDRDSAGIPVGFWVKLTIKDVSKLGYGSYTPPVSAAELGKMRDPNDTASWNDSLDPDWRKKTFSDGLSTAAMRFGIALQLWNKTVDNTTGASLKPVKIADTVLVTKLKDFFADADASVRDEVKKRLNGKKLTDISPEEQQAILDEYEPF